jgi:hypothetical protein
MDDDPRIKLSAISHTSLGLRVGFGSLLAALLLSCQPAKKPLDLKPAFYHWKQEFSLSSASLNYLDSLGVDRLYVRFFDVGWDGARQAPVPLSVLQKDSFSFPEGVELVPTLFITEACMARLDEKTVDSLVQNVVALLERQLAGWPDPVEYQIDCDWAGRSRTSFFRFLGRFKKAVGRPVSATLRLHQLKYPDHSGIPPVDRGMVMYYNMGEVDAPEEKNSILDNRIGERYVKGLQSYPLPLDLALPLFRWGAVFREGEMLSLIHGLSEADLADSLRFRRTGEGWFELQKSTYIQGYYLYAGDRIRLEAAEPESLRQASEMWADINMIDPDGHLVFYHLDAPIRETFPYEELRPVLQQLAPASVR